MNQDYIKTHLCESLTNPDLEDCDGFCYLKKQVKKHQDGHGADHSETTYVMQLPIFLYYSEVNASDLIKDSFTKEEIVRNDFLANQLFTEPLLPPPKS